MNGDTGPHSEVVTTPFDNLRLSLDPATIDQSLRKRKARSIEQDGTVTYDDARSVNEKLTEQLETVWNEYPNGFRDITEEALHRKPPEEVAITPRGERKAEEKGRDVSRMMSWDDMEKLRSDLYLQLNDARNELWFVLELAKTLAVSAHFTSQPPPAPDQSSQKKGAGRGKQNQRASDASTSTRPSSITEPPVLPPGTYSTTPSSEPSKPTHAQVDELETVLAAKQQALDECSALIDSAVSELQLMASAGDRFWQDVRSLKYGKGGKGQWAIVPKPDFGRAMGEGEKAKDLIIPYAVDEGTRQRCLAAFDLDPIKRDALAFGARHHLRLRATLRDESGAVVSSTLVNSNGPAEVRSNIEAAQMEAFDEDLFHEIRGEASRLAKNDIEQRSVAIPAVNHVLSFELYDPRTRPSASVSPLCDLILSSARLGLLNILRQRKANLVSLTSSSKPLPMILQPIIDALRYRQLCAVVHSTLENFAITLNKAGVETNVLRRVTGTDRTDSPDLQHFMLGKAGAEVLHGTYELDVTGCRGVTIDTAAPYNTIVRLSNVTFPLSIPDDLAHVLSEELSSQILVWVHQSLKRRMYEEAGETSLFFDELEDAIDLAHLGLLRISIPPPFHTVLGNINNDDVSEDLKIEGFDARRDRSLDQWMDGVVETIVAYRIAQSEKP
ncbi:hypothetical protein IAR55_006567 [Kwoniella newhampshirensis]|uniref:Mediator of RNA polymerase II transcription subunit 17 n=1 Tax=Kwoniella newhampshirensis TaxID=1651941 RepID=A0AAW0YX63_9TREE